MPAKRRLSDPGLDALIPVDEDTPVPWEGGARLKQWWFAARGDRAMPRFSDFSPRVMGRYLAGTIVFDVVERPEGDPGLIIRLAGEDFRRTAGHGLKRRDAEAIPDSGPVRARLLWAVTHRRPYMALDLPSHWAGKDHVYFKSLVVPLGEGAQVRHLIGHAHYYLARR